MTCPTCGGKKKDHPKRMWDAHMSMHKSHMEHLKKMRKLAKKRA